MRQDAVEMLRDNKAETNAKTQCSPLFLSQRKQKNGMHNNIKNQQGNA
jgi:hypothetical protein